MTEHLPARPLRSSHSASVLCTVLIEFQFSLPMWPWKMTWVSLFAPAKDAVKNLVSLYGVTTLVYSVNSVLGAFLFVQQFNQRDPQSPVQGSPPYVLWCPCAPTEVPRPLWQCSQSDGFPKMHSVPAHYVWVQHWKCIDVPRLKNLVLL